MVFPPRTLVASLALLVSSAAHGATFTVTNTGVSGAGSLRQAILDANAAPDLDTIAFAIVGPGTKTIGGSLPTISRPVLIDGYTQPMTALNTATDGSTNAVLGIRLDGSAIRAGDAVLTITSGGVIIRGLNIAGIKAGGSAILVSSKASNVSILGCFLGTSASGLAGSSAGTGVVVEGTATIGSPLPEDRNLISGNGAAGIALYGDNSVVQNNLIGSDKTGTAALANGVGVLLEGKNSTLNLVGGLDAGAGNDIAGNLGAGIRVPIGSGNGNRFEHNRIRDNGGLGIDLGPEGVTPNDEGDVDGGPNHLQNFPDLDFASVSANVLRIRGYLEARPGEYFLEFFTSPQADPSGFGEGAAYAGFALVAIADEATTAPFAATFDLGSPPAQPLFVTATAQDIQFLDTSEFSLAIEAVDAGTSLTVVNTNDSGEGSLRGALEAAAAQPDPNTILFSIPGGGTHTIAPLTPLAVGEAPVLIDGYSQPGSKTNTLAAGTNAVLRIAIDGSRLATAAPSGPQTENGQAALEVTGGGAVIRGLAIHGAPGSGIRAVAAEGVVIEGNFLGTDASGAVDLGNGGSGIDTGGSAGVRIGGQSRGARNLISGNDEYGVFDSAQGTAIVGNVIGADAASTLDLGNGMGGIAAFGAGTTIGGDGSGPANVIRGNGGSGVEVGSDSAGVAILGNDILGNDALGIDLLEAGDSPGVTPNDTDDADTGGGNALQNFPELTSVTAFPGQLGVQGTLDVPAGAVDAPYTIRVFENQACDSSGHGEGANFLGSGEVVLSGDDESFSFALAAFVEGDVQITATATDTAAGNTSEFSSCIEVGGETPLCGDASLNGTLAAGDALLVLYAAVGSAPCELCVCDANGTGTITSPDALLVLRAAVGQPVSLVCPACG